MKNERLTQNIINIIILVLGIVLGVMFAPKCGAQTLKLYVIFDEYVEVCTDPENPKTIMYAGAYHTNWPPLFSYTFRETDTLYVATDRNRYTIIGTPAPDRKEKVYLDFEWDDYEIMPYEPYIVQF